MKPAIAEVACMGIISFPSGRFYGTTLGETDQVFMRDRLKTTTRHIRPRGGYRHKRSEKTEIGQASDGIRVMGGVSMAKQQKIKVISYVRVGEELVETGQLTPEQKIKLATRLKTTYLNALFAGQAEFRPA